MKWPDVVVTIVVVVVVAFVGASGVKIVEEDVTGQYLEGKSEF